MQSLGASRTAIVGSVGPVSTIGLGAVFLHEHISLMQILGTALVLGGVWLVGRSSARKPLLNPLLRPRRPDDKAP
jgi:drug/metabolite transporter (DMT)-like permease